MTNNIYISKENNVRMEQNSYEKFFANFSNKTRLQIVTKLMDGPLSVGEIVSQIGGEQSNVSHQLEHLRKCGILNMEKKGKNHIYSLNEKTVMPMLEIVEKHVSGCGACNCCGRCK